jgi:hypothetical protein
MAGRAYFKVYRQFKMYNDPRFNPALVAERAQAQGHVRLLIVKTTSMGDVVHAMPAVTDMLRALPGTQVDWLVEKPFAAIPALHPGVQPRAAAGLAQVAQEAAERATWRPWAACAPSCGGSPTT